MAWETAAIIGIGATSVVSAAASARQAQVSRLGYEHQERVAQREAEAQRQAAREWRNAQERRMGVMRENFRAIASNQRVRTAGMGVLPGTGTALLAARENARRMDDQMAEMRWQAETSAREIERRGNVAEQQAIMSGFMSAATPSPWMAAGTSLLSSASRYATYRAG